MVIRPAVVDGRITIRPYATSDTSVPRIMHEP